MVPAVQDSAVLGGLWIPIKPVILHDELAGGLALLRGNYSHKEDKHRDHPPKYQSSPTNLIQDEPSSDGTDRVEAVLAPSKLERILR